MHLFRRRSNLLVVGVLATLWAAASALAADRLTVAETFDRKPFEYRISPLAERSGYRIYQLSYPSPVSTPVEQNNTVPAEFYLPDGIKPGDPRRPAVICLHILDGNEPLTDVVCSVLAARGIPAISFKLPYYGPRGLPKGPEALADDPRLFVGAIAQAGEDIRRTIDLLASRPEIDPQRIGITGISLGGIIAATAAGAEPRLHRAGLILAGGDLLQIIHHARETRPLSKMLRALPPADRADVEARLAAVDPLKFAPLLSQRAKQGRVLMINAAEDEVIPRACTEKLAAALGIADRVTWLPGLGHYTAMAELPRALRATSDFFAQDLPPGAVPIASPVAQARPLQRLVSLVQQGAAMLADEPGQGRCHFVELQTSVVGKDRKPTEGRIRLVRGAGGRFALQCKLPQIGEVSLGQGAFPWMVAGGKTVLAGTKNAAANANPLAFVEPRHLVKLRMANGIVGTLALAPDVLDKWITVSDDGPVIRIAAKDKSFGAARVAFLDDGRTPEKIAFDVAGAQGSVEVRGWHVDAIAQDAQFEPPADLPRQEVDQADLQRVFSAMLNLALAGLE